MGLRGGIGKSRRSKSGNSRSYETMMKTLLLQNQQIIIQQQNMMFMVMKQFHPELAATMPIPGMMGQPDQLVANNHQMQQPHQSIHQVQQTQPLSHHTHLQHHHDHNQQTPNNHQHNQQQRTQHHTISNTATHLERQSQQMLTNLQDNLGSFMTPAASEQDPISENGKPDNGTSESDALSALLEGDGLLSNNLLYNPCTDVGSITPYKNHHNGSQGQQQPSSQAQPQSHHHTIEHQTPSYYSSGCESLSTPRVEQQCPPVSISQNVVKNLNNSFKSPSKPQINVQIMSGSATHEMRKAKIIQSMNISEFLRQVHHDDAQKGATQ